MYTIDLPTSQLFESHDMSAKRLDKMNKLRVCKEKCHTFFYLNLYTLININLSVING